MFYFIGSGYIPSPRPVTGQSFADVGTDSEFVPFPRPGLVQSFEDVAEGPGFVPFPRQPSTMQDETTPNGAETESANVSVNGGETSSIGMLEDARESEAKSNNQTTQTWWI